MRSFVLEELLKISSVPFRREVKIPFNSGNVVTVFLRFVVLLTSDIPLINSAVFMSDSSQQKLSSSVLDWENVQVFHNYLLQVLR